MTTSNPSIHGSISLVSHIQQRTGQKDFVTCLTSGQSSAAKIVEALVKSGISAADISVLTRHEIESHPPRGAHVREDTLAGAGAGMIAGSGLAWLTAIGVVAAPFLGPFVGAGPLLAGILGGVAGSAVGGLAGALVGFGFRDQDATHIEEQLHKGKMLIAVQVHDSANVSTTKMIFHALGGVDIAG